MADPHTPPASESASRTPQRPALSRVAGFQAAGPLRRESLYIERAADAELLLALLRAQCCHLLGPPRSGKSSLRLRAMERLAAGGARPVAVDVYRMGPAPEPEPFFFGLIAQIAAGLQLQEPTHFWLLQAPLSPVHRFANYLAELPRRGMAPLVVFIEDLDLLRGHPLSADLLSALSRLLLGRGADPALQRLTFCLIGSTAPEELPEGMVLSSPDPCRQVFLPDFTPAEAEAFLPALREVGDDPAGLLSAVWQWTDGHPAMMQALCEGLAMGQDGRDLPAQERPDQLSDQLIARLVEEMFLRPGPGGADVQTCLQRLSTPDRLAGEDEKLALYRRVHAGEQVAAEEGDRVQRSLRLAGLIKEVPKQGGPVLRVRNRIIARAIDPAALGGSTAGPGPDAGPAVVVAGAALPLPAPVHEERTRLLTGGIVCLSLLTVVLFLCLQWALAGRRVEREAHRRSEQAAAREREAREALQRRLIAEEEAHRAALLAAWPDREMAALVAGIRAVHREQQQGGGPSAAATRSLSEALSAVLQRGEGAQQEGTAPGNVALTLKGHRGPVVAVAYAPDGSRLVSASLDGTARLWDTRTGQSLSILGGHAGKLYAAAFSPDGLRVVTAGHDGIARLWDGRTGEPLAALAGHSGEIYTAAFSAFGTRIVTAGEDRTARLWDGRTGQAIALLTGHGGKVLSAIFSPDGTRVATTSSDHTARLWDGRTGQSLATLSGHTSIVYAAAFSPDGLRVATASFDHTARLWDGQDGHLLAVLAGHSQPLAWVAFSGDGGEASKGGRRIATASHDGTLRLWDGDSGRLLFTLNPDGPPTQAVAAALSPSGALLAGAGAGDTALLWDTATGRPLGPLQEQAAAIYAMAFSPDGAQLCTASGDHTVRLYPATARGLYTLGCQLLSGRPLYRLVRAECGPSEKEER